MAGSDRDGRKRSGIGKYEEYNGFGEFDRNSYAGFDNDERVMDALTGKDLRDEYYGGDDEYYEEDEYYDDEEEYYEDEYDDEYEDEYYDDGDDYYEEEPEVRRRSSGAKKKVSGRSNRAARGKGAAKPKKAKKKGAHIRGNT